MFEDETIHDIIHRAITNKSRFSLLIKEPVKAILFGFIGKSSVEIGLSYLLIFVFSYTHYLLASS